MGYTERTVGAVATPISDGQPEGQPPAVAPQPQPQPSAPYASQVGDIYRPFSQPSDEPQQCRLPEQVSLTEENPVLQRPIGPGERISILVDGMRYEVIGVEIDGVFRIGVSAGRRLPFWLQDKTGKALDNFRIMRVGHAIRCERLTALQVPAEIARINPQTPLPQARPPTYAESVRLSLAGQPITLIPDTPISLPEGVLVGASVLRHYDGLGHIESLRYSFFKSGGEIYCIPTASNGSPSEPLLLGENSGVGLFKVSGGELIYALSNPAPISWITDSTRLAPVRLAPPPETQRIGYADTLSQPSLPFQDTVERTAPTISRTNISQLPYGAAIGVLYSGMTEPVNYFIEQVTPEEYALYVEIPADTALIYGAHTWYSTAGCMGLEASNTVFAQGIPGVAALAPIVGTAVHGGLEFIGVDTSSAGGQILETVTTGAGIGGATAYWWPELAAAGPEGLLAAAAIYFVSTWPQTAQTIKYTVDHALDDTPYEWCGDPTRAECIGSTAEVIAEETYNAAALLWKKGASVLNGQALEAAWAFVNGEDVCWFWENDCW